MYKTKQLTNAMLNMKSIFRFSLFLMMFIATLLSCSDDDGPGNGSGDKPTADTAQVIVLSHDKFLNSSDVLVSSDTSYITVSKPYLKTIDKEITDSSFVVVWRANNELPFVRLILSTSDAGNNRLKVNIGPADFAQVIPPGEYNLTSDLYINPDEKARTNDGGINSNYYREEVTADSIVYHPVAIIPEKREVSNDDENYTPTSLDSIPYTMVEDLAKTNFDFDRNLIHAMVNIKDLYFPFGDDKVAKVGFANLGGEINVGLRMKLETGMRWSGWWPKPYLKEFKSSIFGNIGFKYDFRVGMQIPIEISLPPFTIVPFPQAHFVYFLGPVPVVVTSSPGVVVEFLGKVKAGMYHQLKGSYSYNFELGCVYTDSSGKWRLFSEKHTDSSSSQSGHILGEAVAELGLFFKADGMVYGCAGPTLRIGPSLRFEGTGDLDFDKLFTDKDYSPQVDASLKFLLGAFVGAKLKVHSWEIGSWEARLNLYEYTLWEYKKKINFGATRSIDPEKPLILQ